MTKTQIKILALGKRSEEVAGIHRIWLRFVMFVLEIVVILHRIAATFYQGKDQSFQRFATRDKEGSFVDSYTSHERFRKTSKSGAIFSILLALLYVAGGIFVPNRNVVHAATFTVNDLGDGGDGICDENCTLRDAIEEANAAGGDVDSINFDVFGTIYIGAALPNLSGGSMTIDGDNGSDGTPDIVLDGTSAGSVDGITITSDNNTIRGLSIQHFSGNGIRIRGNANTVVSSYIGTNLSGTASAANTGNGILIEDVPGIITSTNNTIGSDTAGLGNVISGNTLNGVLVTGATTSSSQIIGNKIGTNAAGTAALANGAYGVRIESGATNNAVGGNLNGGNAGTAPGNIVSGNTSGGVLLLSDSNLVAGNVIGLGSDGSAVIANGNGVATQNSDETIGGPSSDYRNIISGNTVGITSSGGSDLHVQNNFIGTDRSGTTAKPNTDKGIQIGFSSATTIEDNVVASNPTNLYVGSDSTIRGNKIGTNATGTAALSGSQYGIFVLGGTSAIGSTSASDRNIISGNSSFGVGVVGSSHVTLQGNYVGTNASGSAAIPNDSGVVFGLGANGSTVGGNTTTTACSGACNVIAGNTTNDVKIDSGSHDNIIKGNFIGVNAEGTKPLVWDQTDTKISVLIKDGSYNNQIGGSRDENIDELGDGNVISGNQETSGAALSLQQNASNGSTGNAVYGNLIGTSPAGAFQDAYNNVTGAAGSDGVNDFGNYKGISCSDSSYCTIGDGTSAHTNLVSGNKIGISLYDAPHATVNGNYIGTEKTGTLAFSETAYQGQSGFLRGISLMGGASNAGLSITGNTLAGFYHASPDLSGGVTSANFGVAIALGDANFHPDGELTAGTIAGNFIGTNKSGSAVIKNNAGVYCFHASGVTVGGSDSADKNIISGNGDGDVGGPFLTTTTSAGLCQNNTIQGNYFGTKVSGTVALGNGAPIQLLSGSQNNTWQDNVIAASTSDGIRINDNDSDTFTGNKIGVGSDGTTSLGNAGVGIDASSMDGSTFTGNTISRNTEEGIKLSASTSNTIENNTIAHNTLDGILLTDAETNNINGNTIADNGENGVTLTSSSSNTIGRGGAANTISGHTKNGIVLQDASNSNHVDSNTITDNGNAGPVTGAGVYIHLSASNTILNNAINENVRGLIMDASEGASTEHNTVSGGTINENLSSGVLLQNPRTQFNTITGVTISGNHAYGIDNRNTHSATYTSPEAGDNTLTLNTISLNVLSGIHNLGASPRITQNTISENAEHGVYNVVDYGASTSPDTASDDVLSEPVIGGSGTSKNTFNSNAHFGVYSIDTGPANKATLNTENTFDNGNVSGRIRQDWYGLVQTTGVDGNPEASATVKVYGNNVSDPLTQFTTGDEGYGPATSSLTDVQTWQVVPEYIVSPSGTAQVYTPHTLRGFGSTGETTFSFNGEPLSSTTPFGNINGRYQVATIQLEPLGNTVDGTVYNDANKNGTNDAESGLSNVAVRLYKDTGNGTFDTTDALIESTTSDTIGGYVFENVGNGNYFVEATAPSGYEATTTSPSEKITLDNADGGEMVHQDFGYAAIEAASAGTISGTVFTDSNKNKILDTGEKGIAHVTLHLYKDSNDNNAYDETTDEEIESSTTASSGKYQLTNVTAGKYFIHFLVPASYTLTTENNPTKRLEVVAGETITENFGLIGTVVVTQPTPPVPPPAPTPVPIVTKIISGAGVLPREENIQVANNVAASAATGVGLVNLLLATPGAVWPAFIRLLGDLFSEPLLALFGSRKLPWGRLFNAATKRPIDLGLVRLYDARTRTLVGTAVTDAAGRFKFLPKAGLYTAKASKASYSFPSTLLAAAPSYEKDNLYFGDQFRIDEQHQTFTKDIPLDPNNAKTDIKEIAKLRFKQTAHTVVAFSGIGISIVNVILLTTPLTIGLLILHAILLIVFWRLALPAKPKSWGRVYDADTKKPIAGAIVRIYDSRFGRLLDTAISDRNGRYGFLVGPAEYSITPEARGFIPLREKKNPRDYIGGNIRITKENEAVSADIPMRKNP